MPIQQRAPASIDISLYLSVDVKIGLFRSFLKKLVLWIRILIKCPMMIHGFAKNNETLEATYLHSYIF